MEDEIKEIVQHDVNPVGTPSKKCCNCGELFDADNDCCPFCNSSFTV